MLIRWWTRAALARHLFDELLRAHGTARYFLLASALGKIPQVKMERMSVFRTLQKAAMTAA